MVRPAAMDAKASSEEAYGRTTPTLAGSAGCVLWTKTKGINVDTADFESVSEPA